jgi:predicted phosphohydrolase
MRLVVTSDTHFPFSGIPDGDVFLHCGDLMYTGYLNEWNPLLDSLRALPHKEKYLIAGNHDIHMEVYTGPALAELRSIGVKVVGPPASNNIVSLPNGMTLLGVPFVTNLSNWAFNETEERIREYMEAAGSVDIVASHSPPMGILSRIDSKTHAGVSAFRAYLKRFRPKYWFCGHIHESYGHASVQGCEFYNVAMCNHEYKQVNAPVVLDL